MTRDDNLTRRFTPEEVQAAREALAGSKPEPPIGAVLAEALGAERIHAGEWIQCARCGGHGVVDGGRMEVSPDECPDCSGGAQWVYPSGVVAQYPGGPLRGRVSRPADGAVRSHPDRVDGRPQDATPDASPDEAP